MPGTNPGNQLNLFLFELLMITRDPNGLLPDIVQTICVHPMVVVAESIEYSDNALSTVTPTHDGVILTKAGRAPRRVSFQGTFGVETRGLGIYIGTGELRLQRFYHEIVRLSDAITAAQVAAEDDPFRSPIVSLLLRTFDPERSSFAVNFYDLWHDIKFECSISSFQFGKKVRRSAAVGLTDYTMAIQEAGPIVVGGVANALIGGLFEALTTWNKINALIESYTVDAIAGALVDAGGILVNQFQRSIDALTGWVDSATDGGDFRSAWSELKAATGLLNGFVEPGPAKIPDEASPSSSTNAREIPTTGLVGYLADADLLIESGTQIRDAYAAQALQELDAPAGQIDWSSQPGEGDLPTLSVYDRLHELDGVLYAARFQRAAGALYGMGREEYAAFVAAAGRSGRRAGLAGSITHTVSDTDTIASLVQQYGVDFDEILRLNQMHPEEALLVGTVLRIPASRVRTQPSRIDGLPVFGSHIGREAWGRDLRSDLAADSDGNLIVLSGEDVLIQGVDWIVLDASDELLRLASDLGPIGVEQVLRTRVAALLRSDRRIASVQDVKVGQLAEGVEISAVITTINGVQINTGAR